MQYRLTVALAVDRSRNKRMQASKGHAANER